MKKLALFAFSFVFLFSGFSVLAQTNDLPLQTVLPGNPFYGFKLFVEDIGTFFTFGDKAKSERLINLAETRLAEAKALAERGDSKRVDNAVKDYQDDLDNALKKAESAKTKGYKTDDLLTKISDATARHQAVLERVYEKVPEQAREAIKRAMETSLKGHENAMEAISKEREDAFEMEKKQQEMQMEQQKKEMEQQMEEMNQQDEDAKQQMEQEQEAAKQQMEQQMEADKKAMEDAREAQKN